MLSNGECTRVRAPVSSLSIRRGARRGPYRGAWMPLSSSSRTTRARSPAPRLEQLEHPRVVAARLAGQRPGDEVGQVEVADADRIRVAERPDRDLGRRPRPDAGHGGQPRVGVLDRQRP